MYFDHHVTPLTSHIRRNLLQLILPHMVDHIFMASLVPLQTLYPMESHYPLMFQYHPLKTLVYCCTRLLTLYACVHVTFDLKPVYIGMCAK